MRGTAIRLERVSGVLPAGFDTLRAEAGAEGHRFLDRLAADWASGATRFDQDGEALLAAHSGSVLAGIGGLTIDPAMRGALRMRRFYVAKALRRAGLGRALAAALLERALASGRPITVNAAPGSVPFWERLGFRPDENDGHTHVFDLPIGP